MPRTQSQLLSPLIRYSALACDIRAFRVVPFVLSANLALPIFDHVSSAVRNTNLVFSTPDASHVLSLHVWRKTLRGGMPVTLPTTTKSTTTERLRESRDTDLDSIAFFTSSKVGNKLLCR
jgi:hypothetical protein